MRRAELDTSRINITDVGLTRRFCGGVALIETRLAGYFHDTPDLWFASGTDELAGVLYCTREPMTDGTWNVLMLIVSADAHGNGHGRALMQHVEAELRSKGARLVIVETSGASGFERARAFYPQCGYTEEARLRNFYAAGDDKVVFTKALVD
ncbi:MAG: GNAT family N-acetyltransferase [Gemmatimonadales bacterium]